MVDTENSLLEEGITVEVAYALAEKQEIVSLTVPLGTTARQAVELSDIGSRFPDLDVDGATMGIFSQILGSKGVSGPDDYCLQAHDRVEIYRPLIVDPKEVRRERAAKARQRRAEQKAGEAT